MEIKQAIDSSPILKTAGVHPSNLIIVHNGASEEIDIVLWVKDKILIGEAKCIFFPTEPIEYYNYFETLREKAKQIKRKLIAVENEKEALLEALRLTDKVNIDTISVIPFVLVNQVFGVGFPIDNVPVIDLRVLNLYFSDGSLDMMVTFDENGKKHVEEKIKFYNDEDEAAQNIAAYLQDPPQIRLYKEGVSRTLYPTVPLEQNERPFLIVGFDVKLPIPDAELKFRGDTEAIT